MLTVLLATRSGAETLPGVLECYCQLAVPTGGWKLVIVDNGSTDRTRDIIYSYQNRLPLKYVYEAKPGKNVALNTGLDSIAGDLVVLTDDDAFPHKDWLAKMRAAADAHPEYAIFGGAIIPRWQFPPDPWILDWLSLGQVFAITDPSAAAGPTTEYNLLFGPNMAVRADVFARGYRFNPQIGPSGSSYPMGSETDLVRRLYKEGAKAWYCQDAVVEHFIAESHMRVPWILGRAVRFGRGQYRLFGHDECKAFPSWLGVPRYMVRAILVQLGLTLMAFLHTDREKLFHTRWELNYLWGQAVEARRMRAETTLAGKLKTLILKCLSSRRCYPHP